MYFFFFLSSDKIAVLPAKMRETDWAKFREVKDNKFEGDPMVAMEIVAERLNDMRWKKKIDRLKLILNYYFFRICLVGLISVLHKIE